MKTFVGLVVMGWLVLTLVMASLVRLLIDLSPYLLIAVAVLAVLRHRRHRPAHPPTGPVPGPVTSWTRPVTPRAAGWVLVPVWMGPERRPPAPVVDAEVLDGHGNGNGT